MPDAPPERLSDEPQNFSNSTSHSLVDGKVPVLPKFLQVGRVPPVVVEVPVSEAEELPDGVEEGVEVDVEEAEPDDVVWQGQLEESLHGQTPVKAEIEECQGNEDWMDLVVIIFTRGKGPGCG